MMDELDRAATSAAQADGPGGVAGPWVPAIEILEQNGNYVVRTELAGMKPEDVKVEVRDGVLVIQGERKFEEKQESGDVRRTERHYGQFLRTIPLPEGASVDRASAKYENGVLEFSVPAAPQKVNSRTIPIQGVSGGTAAEAPKQAS
jgi:HSP20 family protein